MNRFSGYTSFKKIIIGKSRYPSITLTASLVQQSLVNKVKRSLSITMSLALDTSMVQYTETAVTKTSLLVLGATGTLGRQIVRRALDEGYNVRCVVRPREIPADFLRDLGATVVNADLKDPTSIPAALVGIHTVIDAATARPEESIQKTDWEGKVALVQAAQAMGIQRYIFFSILDCDKHPSVPLMNIKACTEDFIKNTGLNYTIFRLCGLMQAIIGNYAIPILEERSVWGTNDETRTAYMDTQDIAKMTLAALRRSETIGCTLTLAGPKAWTTQEVINLCENLSEGSKAKVTKVPSWLLRGTRSLLSGFEWGRDVADRLAFTDIVPGNPMLTAKMDETYNLLGLDPSETLTLEQYLGEYYSRIIKKLKEVGAESRQTDFYV
jgi:uncharacterized protein YbjT (DUF2867 family)